MASNVYDDMVNRTSMVVFGSKVNKLTHAEKSYVINLLDKHLAGDTSRGGFSPHIASYIKKGGKLPSDLWWKKNRKKIKQKR